MRISRRIVLAVILCMVVCLAACSKIAPETSKDYDNESSIPTQENQQRPLDIPQLETDNSETKNEENQMEISLVQQDFMIIGTTMFISYVDKEKHVIDVINSLSLL